MESEHKSITDFLKEADINLLDATEKMEELGKFIPKIKSWLPKIKEYEKTFGLKKGQKMIYSLIFSDTDVLVLGLVVEIIEGRTVVVGEKFKVKAFEKIENFTSYLPAT